MEGQGWGEWESWGGAGPFGEGFQHLTPPCLTPAPHPPVYYPQKIFLPGRFRRSEAWSPRGAP